MSGAGQVMEREIVDSPPQAEKLARGLDLLRPNHEASLAGYKVVPRPQSIERFFLFEKVWEVPACSTR